MGVDTGLLVRFTRGLLTELGIVPEGVFNVSRDQWETGNQMAVTEDGLPGDPRMDEGRAPGGAGDRTRSISRSTSRTATSSIRSIPGRSSSTRARSPRPPRSSTWPANRGPCRNGAGTRPTSGFSRETTASGAIVARNVYEAAETAPGEADRHLRMRPWLPVDALGGLQLGRLRPEASDRIRGRDPEAVSRGGPDQRRSVAEPRARDLP